MLDFRLVNEGSLFLLCPNTDAAGAWVDSNIPKDAPRLGRNVAIEHGFIRDVIDGIRQEGLTVGG